MQIRGAQAALYKGSLPEVISPYMQRLIEKTGGATGPVGLQFIADVTAEQSAFSNEAADPQQEERYEVAPGLIYKYRGKVAADGSIEYSGRALWTISRFCATYCRFCFRGRMVGMPISKEHSSRETLAKRAYLSPEDISQVAQFIEAHPEINEVILSGGDPLICPEPYFAQVIDVLEKAQQRGQVKFVRIHTRAPVTNPEIIQAWHYRQLARIKLLHLVLHINHPLELTEEVLVHVQRLRTELGVLLFSQSVLLKGVNDSVKVLRELFTKCAEVGIRPYYLHYTDPVPWAERFRVPFPQAVKLWQELRPTLSGIVDTVKFVVDTPQGVGKVAVPESRWDMENYSFPDFSGKLHSMK